MDTITVTILRLLIQTAQTNNKQTLVGKTQDNLLIIGPLPEPKGGVSIHITRLSDLMQDRFNVRFIDESPIRKSGIFNLHSMNLIGYLKLLSWADIVHIHSGVSLLRFIHILAASLLSRKIIVTIHSFTRNNGYQATATSLILKLPDKVIIVSKEISEILKLNNCLVKPAFIPPNLAHEPELPKAITEWIDSRKAVNNTILAANAFRIAFHDGTDLYGIDLCIKMLNELVNGNKRDVSLIFVLASLAKSEKNFERYKSLIKQSGLANHMMLVRADLSFVKIIEISDVILRPTCTDGDALTVREALFLDTPVIASDVVSRPVGAILFKNRNHESMAEKVIDVLDTAEHTKRQAETLSAYKDYYTDLYLI